MSIELKGNLKKGFNTSNIKISGQEPTLAYVSVDVIGDVNRDTKASLISKYLKDGWQWSLFTPIAVAQFPEGSGIPDKLVDGDHRRHMYRLAFPNAKTIPALIYKLNDMQEYHKLFSDINCYKRKSASKEEVFLHEVLSGDTRAESVNSHLITCGLSVVGSSENGGRVGDTKGPEVKIGGFNRCLKFGVEDTRLASSLIKETWPQDVSLSMELLEGLTIVYNTYPILKSSRSTLGQEFKQWFQNQKKHYKQKIVSTDLKQAGGNKVNKAALCIALAIVSDFRKVEYPGGSRNKATKFRLSLINNKINK